MMIRKLVTLSLITFVLGGCSKTDEKSTNYEEKSSSTSTSFTYLNDDDEEVTISASFYLSEGTPLVSSTEMTYVSSVLNTETNEDGGQGYIAGSTPDPGPGWLFDGDCCYIYGYYTVHENGWEFEPAEPVVQYMFNNCDYCDVA